VCGAESCCRSIPVDNGCDNTAAVSEHRSR
jgi:hypothetical protein